MEGFSPRNLKYMRSLAAAWPDPEIVPQLVALLPWGHLRVLLDRAKDGPIREWYLRAALEYGWSRDTLAHQIAGRLHERQGTALTNFSRTLPPGDSDMAEQILKDPYNFDFLTLAPPAKERELERGLLIHLRDLRFVRCPHVIAGIGLADRQPSLQCCPFVKQTVTSGALEPIPTFR